MIFEGWTDLLTFALYTIYYKLQSGWPNLLAIWHTLLDVCHFIDILESFDFQPKHLNKYSNKTANGYEEVKQNMTLYAFVSISTTLCVLQIIPLYWIKWHTHLAGTGLWVKKKLFIVFKKNSHYFHIGIQDKIFRVSREFPHSTRIA